MSVRVGIGGWNFPPWCGSFYPQGLVQSRELEHASRQVTSIEINATFYRTQSPASFAKWRDSVPDDFVFSLKAPRVSTNRHELADSTASIERFISSGVAELGDHLGPLLWQFPASRKFDPGIIEGFLKSLPTHADTRRLRHAIETRHESFRNPAYIDLLRHYNIAHAVIDSAKHPLFGDQTADFAYARLQRNDAASAEGYDSAALDQWADRTFAWSDGASTDLPLAAPEVASTAQARDCYVYFISGDKVRAPHSARALLHRLARRSLPETEVRSAREITRRAPRASSRNGRAR